MNKVEDAGLTEGFKNGTVNGTDEYTYSPDGSMTRDNNKGISTIVYNALGKPRQINFTDGRVVAYTYATDGSKLKMAVTVNSVTTTTDYVGGFIYTNNALSFFGSPEGRVVKNGSTYEYQYAIGDHQGNTRVVFSSVTPAPTAPQATWEGDANDNASQYSNIVAGNVVSFTAANHTPSGTKVLRMNQTNKIQATKSLAVYPGDNIDLEVWEYHEGNSGFGTTSTPIATLITNVAGAFGGVSGAPDVSGAIYNGVNSAIMNIGTGGNQGSTRPAAYLNYILFDKNYKVMNAGWQLAPATTFTKQKLSFTTIAVKEAGFIFVWLSYDDDSNNWVYFDDLKVTHTKNNIIQYNEYYPFGLQTATSWTRENNTGNNFLANGGTELNNTSSLYDLEYRNYDPVLGRMHQVDPMAAKYSSLTPYNFSFNDPVAFTDPDGANPVPGEPDHVRTDIGSLYYGRAVTPRLYYGQGVFGHHITPGSGGNWADGITYSDWSPNGGSEMYINGLSSGLTDIGGRLYLVGPGRSITEARESNGKLYVPVTTTRWTEYDGVARTDSYSYTTQFVTVEEATKLGLLRGFTQQENRSNQFHFFSAANERYAIEFMMIAQELYGKEISAYLVDGANGRGVLILPWSKNTREGSDRWIGYHKGTKTITDFNNNKYNVLLHMHTHPDNVHNPSEDDIFNTKQQGIPGVVLSDRGYSLININLGPGDHKMNGATSDIIKGYASDSLFRFLK